MTRMTKTVTATMTGLLGGLALAFLLCLITGVVAVTTGAQASIPGLFTARAGEENGALAIEFVPNFVGITSVAVICALITGLLTLRRSNSTSEK
jgi:H+/gluconate symporter-like permease